jgi:hypothetical protein
MPSRDRQRLLFLRESFNRCLMESDAPDRARQQREYEVEYRRWFATLPPSEQRKLKAIGADQPDGDIRQINGKRRTAEDMDLPDDSAPDPSEYSEPSRSVAAAGIARVLIDIANSRNVSLMLDVALFALGCYDGTPETCETLGTRHGVSKQRFGFLLVHFRDTYGLPENVRGMPLKVRIQQSNQRCQRNSASISQMKSASYTPGSRPARKPCSQTLYQSGRN